VETLSTNKETIAIILSMVIPGAGHIYLGKQYRMKGVKISLIFVIVSFISSYIVELLNQSLLAPLSFFPIFIIWYKQLSNILKITRDADMKLGKV
jgi:hypothetical protein